MGIINSLFVFNTGGPKAGEDGIEVDGAYKIKPAEEQEKEEPDIVFDIEPFTFFKIAPESFLLINPFLQIDRRPAPTTHQ
jgi:hypothetical protein